MSLFARYEQESALAIINQAIDLAMKLDMNSKNFAASYGMNNPVIEESWRRTWWDLYMIDGILASLNSVQHTFRLQHVQSNVPLPCEDNHYAQCRVPTQSRSQSDFLDRAFAAEDYGYSSMAYKIEAVRLLGKVTSIGKDSGAAPDKRQNVERDGNCDEVMFSAHNLIDSAMILLHKPRSSLMFFQTHFPTPCTRPESISAATSAYEVHTSKAIKAANSISKALAFRTPLSKHSPCFVCATLMAAIVHLPAYSMESSVDKASAIKERLQLTINALNSIGEVWPMARAAKSQISQFARDVFAGQEIAAGQARKEAQIQQIDIESMMEDQTWLDELATFEPMEGTLMLEEGEAEPTAISAMTSTPGVA